MKINTDYTFEEINKFIGDIIFSYSDINKGVECKLMKDDTGKDIQAILLHSNSSFNSDCEQYSLIIKYLDKSLVRSYNSIIYTMKFERTFDYLYKECKKSDYIEYRFYKET